MTNCCKILFLILGLLIISSPYSRANEYSLEIINKNEIDLCGSKFEKEVLIAPSLGEIKRSDSLFGFDFQINFDPTVVRMNKMFFVNTISEYFSDHRTAQFDNENGKIYVSAGTLSMTPVSGDKPLIAFGGEFIGNCGDTCEFTFDYFEPTEEFNSANITDTVSLDLAGNIADKDERRLSFEVLSEDMHEIKADSSITITVKVDLGVQEQLDHLSLTANIDTDSVEIVNVTGSKAVKINSTEIFEKSTLIKLSEINSSEFELYFHISSNKLSESIEKFIIKKTDISDCSCITRFDTLDYSIKNLETNKIVGVETEESDLFELTEKKLITKQSNLYLEVFTLEGKLIEEKQCYFNDVYELSKLKRGLYFIKITSDSKTKILKINNY